MSISIRSIGPGELKTVSSLLANLLVEVVHGGASLGFLAPLGQDQARSYWLSLRREMIAGHRLLLVAEDGDRIVGAGQLSLPSWPNARHRAEMQKLLVSAAVRGRGIGRAIVGALHDAARRRGRSLILLGARRGAPAEAFYRRLGYREVGVIPGFAVGTSGERYDNVSFYIELARTEDVRVAHSVSGLRQYGAAELITDRH
jgi:ribosomal protein S18 acetylase RimI-like enzyme